MQPMKNQTSLYLYDNEFSLQSCLLFRVRGLIVLVVDPVGISVGLTECNKHLTKLKKKNTRIMNLTDENFSRFW